MPLKRNRNLHFFASVLKDENEDFYDFPLGLGYKIIEI